MTSFYSDKKKFFVAVDCVIFGFHQGELNLLVLKRNFEPAKGRWSLPGGFLEPEESLHQAAERILYELTGLQETFMKQVHTFGELGRDPGERVISVAYYALININDYNSYLSKVNNAHWVNINELPDMIFDHHEIIDKAKLALRKRAVTEPIGFNLLPEKFTLPQFQALYEAIYAETLDKRNFRKKILKMNILEKLEEKDKLSSKRGAYLYRFNMDKYNDFISKGYNFTI